MKSPEALQAIKDGAQVVIYHPDPEMFSSLGHNSEGMFSIGIFLPDYSNYPADTITENQFLKYHTEAEFEMYEENFTKKTES